jgi:hypothetical protein
MPLANSRHWEKPLAIQFLENAVTGHSCASALRGLCMKLGCLIGLSFVAACAAPQHLSQQQSANSAIVRPQSTARGATEEEIAAAFIGKTTEFSDGGVAQYGADGSYTFTFSDFWNNDRSTGRYSIRPSTICVKFDNGFSRCDTIYIDNGEFTLVNKDDKSFTLRMR